LLWKQVFFPCKSSHLHLHIDPNKTLVHFLFFKFLFNNFFNILSITSLFRPIFYKILFKHTYTKKEISFNLKSFFLFVCLFDKRKKEKKPVFLKHKK
jgi:hypothetical protein